jgi:transposase
MRTVIRKRYSDEFRAQAVALVQLGKPVPEVATELGIGTSILYRWTQSQRQSPTQGGGAPAALTQFGGAVQRAEGEMDEAAELRRLRRENAHLLMENDILKKAAVILGTHTQPQSKLGR